MKPFTSEAARQVVLGLPARRRGDGRGVGPGLRHSEQALLRLLLRFVRNDAGDVGFKWGTAQIARDLGYSYNAVRYARRRLVELGYLEITSRGSGEFGSTYRVAVERLKRSSDDANSGASVHPGENAAPSPQTVNGCPPEGQQLSRGVPSVVTPTRARGSFPRIPQDPPNPPRPSGAGGEISTNCQTALLKGRPCANCRRCGTTARQLAKAAEKAARHEASEARKQAQLAARAEFEAERAQAAAAAERLRQLTGKTPAQLAAEALAAARARREELAIAEHLADVASSQKPNDERKSG